MWEASSASYGVLDSTNADQRKEETSMTASSGTVLDTGMAQTPAAAFHRCFSDFTAPADLFAPDTFYDLLPPLWRFQIEGPGAAFCEQLRSIAQGPVEIEVATAGSVPLPPIATGVGTTSCELATPPRHR
jgi:hypothetical protein